MTGSEIAASDRISHSHFRTLNVPPLGVPLARENGRVIAPEDAGLSHSTLLRTLDVGERCSLDPRCSSYDHRPEPERMGVNNLRRRPAWYEDEQWLGKWFDTDVVKARKYVPQV